MSTRPSPIEFGTSKGDATMTTMLLAWSPNITELRNYQEKVILRLRLNAGNYFVQGKVNCKNNDVDRQNYTVRITHGDGATENDRVDLYQLPNTQTVYLCAWLIGVTS